jgi:hypothetical protein
MPLSELPIMKALMELSTPSSAITLAKQRLKEDPKTQLVRLMETIIDKLQILALRQPRALIIVAQVLDGLLKRQLEVLDDDLDAESIEVEHRRMAKRSTKTKPEARSTRTP